MRAFNHLLLAFDTSYTFCDKISKLAQLQKYILIKILFKPKQYY